VKFRLLLACLSLLWSVSAAGQLTGQFYLEKTSFARWEPVFLYYRLTNSGQASVTVASTLDPEQPGCSGHSISVSSDPVPTPSCPLMGAQGCNYNGPLSQPRLLRPGESYIERFLLNFDHEINTPGDYWVEAKHSGLGNPTEGDAHAKLNFRVEDDTIAPSELQPWLDDLRSDDRRKRFEAARTLASIAPPSLEETLLGFINDPEFRIYTALAFHRLNSPRSMDAMAELMQGPVTNEQMEAAHYLALTDNQRWYPLLRDAAEKNVRISSYPAYAAELGGDKTLPMLIALAKSPDREFTGGNAIMAMGSTGSRNGIPVLLDYLNSPDVNISDRAAYALQLLTHRTAVRDELNRNRWTESAKWSLWWKREGVTARIYKDTECGKRIPLP
jgi:HEAT repeat protein